MVAHDIIVNLEHRRFIRYLDHSRHPIKNMGQPLSRSLICILPLTVHGATYCLGIKETSPFLGNKEFKIKANFGKNNCSNRAVWTELSNCKDANASKCKDALNSKVPKPQPEDQAFLNDGDGLSGNSQVYNVVNNAWQPTQVFAV